jgi:hypothetical protein
VYTKEFDEGDSDLTKNDSDGAGSETLLWHSHYDKYAADWSLDGKFMLYEDLDPKTSTDLWTLLHRATENQSPISEQNPRGTLVNFSRTANGWPTLQTRLEETKSTYASFPLWRQATYRFQQMGASSQNGDATAKNYFTWLETLN